MNITNNVLPNVALNSDPQNAARFAVRLALRWA